MSVKTELTLVSAYEHLTPQEVTLLSDYASWARKAYLAEKLESALQRPAYLGTFASESAANASSHPGLVAGVFVPGDRYYDSGAAKFKTNTGSAIGAATWTAES